MVSNPSKLDIKKLLAKQGEIKINSISNGELCPFYLFKFDGRYSYKVNGAEVGITEKQLDDIISRLPRDIRLLEGK